MAELTAEQKKAARKAEQAANFKKLASSRTEKALQAISMIGGCANRNNYDYTAEQAEKIGTALTEEVAKLGAKFAAALAGKTVSDGKTFEL